MFRFIVGSKQFYLEESPLDGAGTVDHEENIIRS